MALGLLLVSRAALACGPYYYYPRDLILYRVLPYGCEGKRWDSQAKHPEASFADRNCLQWCREVSSQPRSPFSDTTAVRRAVYEYSLKDWERIYYGGYDTNRFVQRLLSDDPQAVQLLYWSKQYESLRKELVSPWYYVRKEQDPVLTQLDELAHRLDTLQPARHRDRYLFLHLKVLWALGSKQSDKASLQQCVDLWRQKRHLVEGSFLKNEAMDYVARCYVGLGQKDAAGVLYRRMGNTKQYMELLYGDRIGQLRALLEMEPNYDFAYELQPYLEGIDLGPWSYPWVDCQMSGRQVEGLLTLAQQAIANPRVRRKAVWRYTAACILDAEGRPDDALAMLQGAEEGDGDAFLRSSVRVMQFYLRCKTDPVDDRLEQYALGELRWMDAQLQREYRSLPDNIKADMSERFDMYSSWSWGSRRRLYFDEAMFRIVGDDSVGLAWRMAGAGRQIRALQMANMACNRWVQVCSSYPTDAARRGVDSNIYYKGTEWNHYDDSSPLFLFYYKGHEWNYHDYSNPLFLSIDAARRGVNSDIYYSTEWNHHDYSNPLFFLADTMEARTLEQYRHRILHPQDDADRWLNARSYTAGDYWQDIIGTHYLRERNYAAAKAHLQYVSPRYQRSMNVVFVEDPFSIDRTLPSHDSTHYKLHFAQRMDSLQHAMLADPDADRRGLAMLEYTIGLQNSFDMCWYLTSYGWSVDADSAVWAEKDRSTEERLSIVGSPYRHRADAVVDQLRSRALRTLRSDDARARYHVRLGQWGTLWKRYANTPTGQHYALVCDKRELYLASAKH